MVCDTTIISESQGRYVVFPGLLCGRERSFCKQQLYHCYYRDNRCLWFRDIYTRTWSSLVLIDVLSDWAHRPSFSIAMLHCEVLNHLRHERPRKDIFGKKIERRRTPVYIVTTSNSKARGIELCPRRNVNVKETVSRFNNVSDFSKIGPPSTNHIDGQETFKYQSAVPVRLASSVPSLDQPMSMPHVLITFSLGEDQTLDLESCTHWLQQIPLLGKWAKFEGVYQTESTSFQPKTTKLKRGRMRRKAPIPKQRKMRLELLCCRSENSDC